MDISTKRCIVTVLVGQLTATSLPSVCDDAAAKIAGQKLPRAALHKASVVQPYHPHPTLLAADGSCPEENFIRLKVHPNAANLSSYIGTLLLLRNEFVKID